MANCKLNSAVNNYANRAVGTPILQAEHYTKSLQDMKRLLKDTTDIIGREDFMEIANDRDLVSKALDNIPRLKDHGLIMSEENTYMSAASNSFLQKLAVNKESVDDIFSKLSSEYGMTADVDVYKENSNKVENPDWVNKTLNKKFNNMDAVSYVRADGTVNYNTIRRDNNRWLYNKYLANLGNAAYVGMEDKIDTPKEVIAHTAKIVTEPIVESINAKINGLQKRVKIGKEKGTLSKFDIANIYQNIAKLKLDAKKFKRGMHAQDVIDYYDSILADISGNLATGEEIDASTALAYVKAINLLKESAILGENNPVLSFKDQQDSDFLDEIRRVEGDAKDLEARVKKIAFSTLQEAIEEDQGETTQDEMSHLGNLSSGIRRFFQGALGLHHIDNNVIAFLDNIINNASVKANSHARQLNEAIKKLVSKAEASGFDTKIMYQKKDGISTGRLVDVFTAKWWTEKNGIMKDLRKRKKFTQSMDPDLLFNSSKEVSDDYKAELIAGMGPYMFNMYFKEAEKMYDGYLKAKKALIDEGATATEIKEFEIKYSPSYRAKNFGHKDARLRGSDSYLVTIPKFTASFGFLEAGFKTVMANKDSSELYRKVRDAYVVQQLSLNKYESKLKPPELGYIGKTAYELMKDGKSMEAAKNIIDSDIGQASLSLRKVKKNKISGEPEVDLQLEIETMPEAIRRIANKRLSKDQEFISMIMARPKPDAAKSAHVAFAKRVKAYKKVVFAEVSKEVEESSSKDFGASIAMANYATYNLIEKKRIEALVRISKMFLMDNLTNPTDEADVYGGAKKTAIEALDHVLYTKFYNISDKDPGAIFNKDKAEKVKEALAGDIEMTDEKGFTDRSWFDMATTWARNLMLGWGLHTAVKNIGQAGFSNIVKAVDSKYMTLPDLLTSYADILMKKNRTIMDNLYVFGDLAHQHDRQLVYEADSWRRKIKPMYISSAAEKFNQGAVAIAVMKGINVTDGTTTKNLFEVINEDGSLDSKWTSDEFKGTGIDLLANVVTKRIRPINMEASGDYHSKLAAEKSMLGKATLMFTKFMPEMIMDRFKGRTMDRRLNEEVQGRFVGLLNVITKKYKGEQADEIDVRGAKAAATELVLAAMFRATFLLLGKLLCDTPECRQQHGATIYALNTMNQLSDDFFMFINPTTGLRKVQEPFAIVSVLQQHFKVANDIAEWAVPGGATGEYKIDGTGYEAGDVKFLNSGKRIVPFYSTNVNRINSLSTKLRYDPTLAGFIED